MTWCLNRLPLTGPLHSVVFPQSRELQCEVVDERQHKAHVIAGLDEKRVFRIWDPVLGLSQKTSHKEE